MILFFRDQGFSFSLIGRIFLSSLFFSFFLLTEEKYRERKLRSGSFELEASNRIFIPNESGGEKKNLLLIP